MNISTHPWPAEQAAFDAQQPIQFRAVSAPDSMDWFDFDADSPEPPTFTSKVLMWRVKPALHPVFASITDQFNSIFGG